MFGKPFYHHTLRKIVASFGSIFANIYLVKRSENSNEIERIKVPLAYGPSERYLGRLAEDPDLGRSLAVKLPRMSFQIQSVQYDSNRKLNTIRKNIVPIYNNGGQVARQYQGVPYKIGIELSIICKYIDDANQIVEQILPWFTPAFSVTINSIPEMEYYDDIPIVLTAVTLQDNYEEDWMSRRDIVWTMTFDVQAMFYGPIVEQSIIQKSIVDTYAATGVADLDNPMEREIFARAFRTTTEVDSDTATYRDEFGYIQTTQAFEDGKRRDSRTGLDVPVGHRIKLDKAIELRQKVPSPTLK